MSMLAIGTVVVLVLGFGYLALVKSGTPKEEPISQNQRMQSDPAAAERMKRQMGGQPGP
jgi:hypothetical protein